MNDRYSRTRLRAAGGGPRPQRLPPSAAGSAPAPVSLPEQAFLLTGHPDTGTEPVRQDGAAAGESAQEQDESFG